MKELRLSRLGLDRSQYEIFRCLSDSPISIDVSLRLYKIDYCSTHLDAQVVVVLGTIEKSAKSGNTGCPEEPSFLTPETRLAFNYTIKASVLSQRIRPNRKMCEPWLKIWMEGCKHEVLTDHNNLSRFMNTKSLSSRQVRWAHLSIPPPD